jgi:actin-like ATPase involved in cell morphogenesis
MRRVTYRLSIDYGTSNTVAALRWPDGRCRPLLFDGSPTLPSAVFRQPDGTLLTGRDAIHSARIDPAGFEPNPKRRIDDGILLLGAGPVPVVEVVAATLRRVAGEAARATAGAPAGVILTYPATWGAVRRTLLVDAAALAGLPAPTLVAEPVAAAAYFTAVLGHAVRPGDLLVVYDLGAGTLDVSAIRRTGDGFEVCDVDGMADFGGADLDGLIVGRVLAALGPDVGRRLAAPKTTLDRRHFRALWDDARTAKEMLSREPSTGLHVPLADRDVHVTRDEFETAAEPHLVAAAALTERVLRRVGATAANLAGLFLVGGGSRVPLAATTLHRATGVAPTVLEQPELVVAEGGLHAATQPPPAPPPIPPPPPFPGPLTPTPPTSPAQPISPQPTFPAQPISPQPTFPAQPISPQPTSARPARPAGRPLVIAALLMFVALLCGWQADSPLTTILLGLLAGVPVALLLRQALTRPAGTGQRAWLGWLAVPPLVIGVVALNLGVFITREAIESPRTIGTRTAAITFDLAGIMSLVLGCWLLWLYRRR